MPKYVETTHPKKIMGLYVDLKKALDALDAAGESVWLVDDGALGITARVDRTDGQWTVVQA